MKKTKYMLAILITTFRVMATCACFPVSADAPSAIGGYVKDKNDKPINEVLVIATYKYNIIGNLWIRISIKDKTDSAGEYFLQPDIPRLFTSSVELKFCKTGYYSKSIRVLVEDNYGKYILAPEVILTRIFANSATTPSALSSI